MNIGEPVGHGRTSDVFAYGSGAVIKIPHDDVPDDWPEFEARQTRAVQEVGAPAPRVIDVVQVKDRNAVVFERVVGPSMWQHMLDHPHEASRLAQDFAAIQRSLLTLDIPAGVPDFADRLKRKIRSASRLTEAERNEAVQRVRALSRGAALLHGDLHPGNVLMGEQGPVVIDWFDAAIGHPIADINRTSILMQPERSAELDHLPGATVELLHMLQQGYVSEFAVELEAAETDVSTWRAVIAAGRLAERAESDETGLLNLWMNRPGIS